MCIVNKSVENNLKAQKLISYNLLGVYFLKYVLICTLYFQMKHAGVKKFTRLPKCPKII